MIGLNISFVACENINNLIIIIIVTSLVNNSNDLFEPFLIVLFFTRIRICASGEKVHN